MSGRLLWPELGPDDAEGGWLPSTPKANVTAAEVLDALARRHPMDGFNGMPGRWVFVREVQATTGSYADARRFDAVAIGLTPAMKWARVVYEVKVSRADWLRELRPVAVVSDRFGERRISGKRAAAILDNRESLRESWNVAEGRKWDEALGVSTEFWIAAPPRCVQVDELPPEAGLVEVRPWGRERELRPKVVRPAPIRITPNPGPGFWAAVLRRACERAA